jgi:NAD(P)-dependent dehydrogenase (short-subunit alcohol dehydrogenase family)
MRRRVTGGEVGDLNGNVWFVTGASAGFGWELGKQVIERGGRLVATARNPDTLKGLVALAPERVLAARLDVTRPAQIAEAVAQASARFGRIDVLVNNAGYGFISAIEEAQDAEIRAVFEVNYFGLVAMTRAVQPLMRAQMSGMIVNISSTAGIRGLPGAGYYSSTKWAMEAFSESLAGEMKAFGVRVLIVEPGPFRTDFAGRSISYPSQPMPEYAAQADMRAKTSAGSGKQAGDPVRKRLADMERSRDVAPGADFPSV